MAWWEWIRLVAGVFIIWLCAGIIIWPAVAGIIEKGRH